MKSQLIVICIASLLILQAARTSANASKVSDGVREKKLAEIENAIDQISNEDCKALVKQEREGQDDIFAACEKIKANRDNLLTIGCDDTDYERLETSLCTVDGKSIYEYK